MCVLYITRYTHYHSNGTADLLYVRSTHEQPTGSTPVFVIWWHPAEKQSSTWHSQQVLLKALSWEILWKERGSELSPAGILLPCMHSASFDREGTYYAHVLIRSLIPKKQWSAADVIGDKRWSRESILMSKYAAEAINQATDCRMLRSCRPLSTVYKTKAYAAETSCNQLFDWLILLRICSSRSIR